MKEQYCIGTWNVRSMNQGKLGMVKQEMGRVNFDIFGINELHWTGMGKFNSDVHYIYYCWQESLSRNTAALIVTKESEMQWKWNLLSRVWLFVILWTIYTVNGILHQNTGVGSLSILQGIFPTQGLNPGFPHCRQILYQLSHKGNPKILKWVAHPFSRGSSQPRKWTRVSCIVVNSLPPELSGKPYEMQYLGAVSIMTEWSLFISKANNSVSQ